jgi:hypothetical protein
MKNKKLEIKYLVIVAVAFLPALCFGQNLDSLRIDLFKSRYGAGNDYKGEYLKESHEAMKKLLSIGSSEALDVLDYYLTTYCTDGTLKRLILVELGKTGSEKAIGVIDDFRTWAKVSNFSNDNQWEWPASIAQCKDEVGVTWSVFAWKKYGIRSLWLTNTINGVDWTEPILINPPKIVETAQKVSKYHLNKFHGKSVTGDTILFFDLGGIKHKLKCQGSIITLFFDKLSFSFSSSELMNDFDNDGLVDDVELLLTTNPRSNDTDRDGIKDGADCNPIVPNKNKINDTTEIKQAVFFNEIATSNSKRTIVAFEKNERDLQEYFGCGGYVIGSNSYIKGFANFSFHDLTINNDAAQISISMGRDYKGEYKEIKLNKINGKWYIVDYGKCCFIVS